MDFVTVQIIFLSLHAARNCFNPDSTDMTVNSIFVLHEGFIYTASDFIFYSNCIVTFIHSAFSLHF